MTPDMLRAAPDTVSLGRRARGFLTPPIAREQGNNLPPLTGDARAPDQRRSLPTGDNDYGDYGYTSFRGLRYPQRQSLKSPFPDGIGTGAYGGGWADGVLTVRDRHVLTRFGHTRNPGGGGSTMPSREGPGLAPVPPRYQMVDTTESWQLGTDNMANEDNPGPHYSVDVLGSAKRFPLGQQDGTLTPVWGPPLDTWREYGARGPGGMHGPAPDVIDPNWVPAIGAGGGGGRGRLMQAGAPGMQPADKRTVYGGVPHGLHSPTAASTVWTSARFASTPQQQPPRLDRPASSKVAGQSLSQAFPPEGAQSSRAVPRTGTGDRRPGLDARFRGRS